MATSTQTQKQAQPTPPVGSVAHIEWSSSDVKKTKNFFGKVFGWTFQEMGADMNNYVMVQNGNTPVGGITEIMPGAPGASATPFVAVADLTKTNKAAIKNGGKIVVESQEVPGMGVFSIYLAPGGPPVAAWQAANGN